MFVLCAYIPLVRLLEIFERVVLKMKENLEFMTNNCCFIDLSRIPVNKGTNSRLGWTKYSDLYEIVHPSLVFISLCLLTEA